MATKPSARMTRVTVTLPVDLLDQIDRLQKNRSSFVVDGIRRELLWRRREALRRSLDAQHPETSEMEEAGLAAWFDSLPQEDAADLVDPSAGRPIAWKPGQGWVEGEE